jgi:hypothetical protein
MGRRWVEETDQLPPPPLCSLPSLRRKTTSRAEEEERTGTRRGVGVATANLRARSGRTSSDPRTRRGEAAGEEEAADSGEERRWGLGRRRARRRIGCLGFHHAWRRKVTQTGAFAWH